MNKLKRKNIEKTLSINTSLLKRIFIIVFAVLLNNEVLAQITFTTTPASTPRNSLGTLPADGQAIATTDTTGMGGLYSWYWTDVNNGNPIQTTLNSSYIDVLDAPSGTYALTCTNPDFNYSAKDTVTIIAPGTEFSIGTDNGSLILCGGADSVNLTVLELCNYPFSGGVCSYIAPQVLGTEISLYNATSNVLVYSTTVFDNVTPVALPTQPLGDWRITAINYDNGAVGDTTFTVSTDTLNLNVSSTNILNSFPLGTITVNATGGNGIYNFLLQSPGQNSLNPINGWVNNTPITGLTTGMYYFEVQSSDGCVALDSVLIQNVCEGQITSTVYDPCDSVVPVSAEINMVGSGPFNFEYSLFSGPNLIETVTTTNDSITFNNFVSSGSYSVTIEETNSGCLITDFYTYSLNPVIVSTTLSQLTAPGATDGSLFLSVDSGLAPFTYIWEENGVTDTSSNSNGIFTKFNLGSGTYCLTIIDANGCPYYDCYEITYFPCAVTLSVLDTIFCYNGQGSLRAVVDTNGTGMSGGPYTFSLYNANNGNLVQSFNSPTLIQNFTGLSSNLYYLEVFDQAYGDVCDPDTIFLSEPDQIDITYTVTQPTTPCDEDGEIILDPIIGGIGPFNIIFFDSIGFPVPLTYTTNFFGQFVMDSLGYSNPLAQNDGRYNIFISDSASSSCTRSFDVFLDPLNGGANFYIDSNATNTTITTSCHGLCDGEIEVTMSGHNSGYNTGCESIGPFVFIWLEGSTTAGSLPDTLKIDSTGTLFYNPSGVATFKNVGPNGNTSGNCDSIRTVSGDWINNFDGTIRLYAYDYYGNPALPPANGSGGDGSLLFTIEEPDEISFEILSTGIMDGTYPMPNPPIDSGLYILECGLSDTLVLTGLSGGPRTNDTTLFSTNILDFANPSGFADTLAPTNPVNGNTYSYFLEVSGFYIDTAGSEFDAAYQFDASFTTPLPIFPSHWELDGSPAPRPSPDVYSASHVYIYPLSSGVHTFAMTLPGYACGGLGLPCMNFKIYRVEENAAQYSFLWTEVTPGAPGTIVGSSDRAYTYPNYIGGYDMTVRVVATNPSCFTTRLVHVEWDRKILEYENIFTSDVLCYGDSSASIIFEIDSSYGFGPYTLYLDNVLVDDTVLNVPEGSYTAIIKDSLFCESNDTIIKIISNDSLWACGVDTQEVAILVDAFTLQMDAPSGHTTSMIMNDGLTYKLVVSGTYKDTWNGTNFKDASYKYINPIPQQIVPSDWTWSGLPLNQAYPSSPHNSPAPQPSPYSYNSSHEYTYFFIGDGNEQTFRYNDADSSYFENAGALNFEIYKIVCSNTDTAFTCFGDSTASAFVLPTGDVDAAPYTVTWRDNGGTVWGVTDSIYP
ncbi:MAG: hypothetical protein ACJ0QC_01050, partial [Flavobacteriales bacterium]